MAAEMPYVWAALPLVLAVIIAIIVWRSARKERSRRRLREQLASTNPSHRRQALEAIDEDVLSKNAAMLCELLETERDPAVLDALAAAVARSRWEPTDDGNIVELRRWVAGRHAHQPPASYEVGPLAPPPLAAVSVDPETADTEEEAEPEHVAASVDEGDQRDERDEALVGVPVEPVYVVDLDADTRDPGGALVPKATMLEPMTSSDLAELVGKVRALLGDGLARMEFVSIDGEVLSTWQAPETSDTGAREPEDASQPTR